MGYEAYAATRYTNTCVSCGKGGAAAKRNDLCRKCFAVKPIEGSTTPVFIPQDPIEAEEQRAVDSELLRKAMRKLTYREQEILKLRYGIGDGYTYTLDEVSRIFKVTRERVRCIEAKGKEKLERAIRLTAPEWTLT